MSTHQVFTFVVRAPRTTEANQVVEAAMKLLKPYQSAMSLEDEISVLEFIEQHPEFDDSIAEEAREKAKQLHDGLDHKSTAQN